MVGAIKAAIGDAVLTFMWVFCSSVLGIASGYVTKALNLQDISYNGFPYPSFIVTITLVFLLVFLFTIIGNALGGASFNPTGTASFYAVGLGSDTLFSMAIRFPAQAVGAAGGALAIMEVIPDLNNGDSASVNKLPSVKFTKLFINGEFQDSVSGKTFESIDPRTGDVIARISEGDKEDVDIAVRAARYAFDFGPWPRMSGADRGKILMKWAVGMLLQFLGLVQAQRKSPGPPNQGSQNGEQL